VDLVTAMRRVSLMIVVVVALAGCSFGPTTKDEVCESYQELGHSVSNANGIFDNAIFSDAGTLSSVAGRYEGGSQLESDAEALDAIADSKSTTVLALMNATQQIAQLCGQQLGRGFSIPG
jgi:hypothetical protein